VLCRLDEDEELSEGVEVEEGVPLSVALWEGVFVGVPGVTLPLTAVGVEDGGGVGVLTKNEREAELPTLVGVAVGVESLSLRDFPGSARTGRAKIKLTDETKNRNCLNPRNFGFIYLPVDKGDF
jgi:hypothetical protein